MRMSAIASAIAAAAVGAVGSSARRVPASSSSAPWRRAARSAGAGALVVTDDTARRRATAPKYGGSVRWAGYSTIPALRRWDGPAFASPPRPSSQLSSAKSPWPTAAASASLHRSAFSGYRYKDEMPWTPIRETTSTSLGMSSDFGTEGFREWIRHPPRSSEGNVTPQPQPSQQQQQKPQQQHREQKQDPGQGEPSAIPFPKLTPGRPRNYRPPHVKLALRANANAETQQQQSLPRPDAETTTTTTTPLLSQDQKDYCDALDPADRDHCLENFRDGKESARFLTVKGGGEAPPPAAAGPLPRFDASIIDRHNTDAEKDFCDAFDTADREHCLESFRDGRESAQFLTVKGSGKDPPPLAAGHLPRFDATNIDRHNTDAEKDFCDAFDPADREHCLESFRDGRESAQFLSVKGGDAPAATRQQVPPRIDSDDVATLSNVFEDGGEAAEEEDDDDDGLLASGGSNLSEHFRDGPRALSAHSGSDVDVSGELVRDDDKGINRASSVSNPLKDKSSRVFYDSPSSMSFRDGKERMTRFKDKAFSAESSGPADELLGGGEMFHGEDDDNNDDADDVDEDELTSIESLLGDNVEEEVRKVAQRIVREVSTETQLVGHKPSLEEAKSAGSDRSTVLSIDPASIDIIPLSKAKAAEGEDEDGNDNLKTSLLDQISPNGSLMSSGDSPRGTPSSTSPLIKWTDLASSGSFVKMFRGSASYIANHRGTLAVYHIPGELLAWEGFPGLMDDIALTWLLGMKIVLVAGCRHQIDLRLEDEDEENSEHGHLGGRVMMSSIRVTDEETLRVVKEEAGFVRFEIERRLAKSLRLHGGLVKGSESLVGNVVSGNFYSAQPFGVVDGIDYCWTGFPRKIEIERIRQIHETNDIVLLTSLGVSPSGEIFNVNSEFLAATVAGSMSASKIIYFNVHGTSFQNKLSEKPVQNLRVSDARNLLAHYKMRIHPKGFALVDLDGDAPQQSVLRTPGSMETLIKVGYSMVALEKGVKRAHILAPENGALVQELYTRDGCGTLISRDIYEGIRRADVNDVSGIYDLIDPLVRSGTLVERPKSTLEKEILSYYVYTRDGLIVATGQLKRYEGGFAEIGCLVVNRDYRRGGRGDAMLGYLERLSLQCGAKKVFVLSTQTMEWFVERGFRSVPVESLPPSRQAAYNKKRRSKIYMKEIDGDRDLDAAELWWSNK